jgi:uncharacterized protein
MQHQNFSLKLKSVDDTGSFVGLGAVYNNVDLGGDQILPGAFARTLAASKTFPLLWQHKSDCPIGTATVSDSQQGLVVAGQLLMDLDEAKRAYTLIKAKVIKGLSIGYDTIQESFENGVRQLKECRIWEFSIVTFPMNEAATISSVKDSSSAQQRQYLMKMAAHHKAMEMYFKSLLGDDYDSLDPANGDPAFLEGGSDDPADDDPDNEEMGMVLSEIRELVHHAKRLQ